MDEDESDMPCDEEIFVDPPRYVENENADGWYQWQIGVESRLQGIHEQVDAMHAGMEYNRAVVETFTQNVQ